MIPKRFDYEKHGWPGSAIVGSQFVRGYCWVCGEPLRKTLRVHVPVICERCDGHRPPGGNAPPADDVTGLQANAIRDMEN